MVNAPATHRRGEHVRQTVLAAAFDELAENGAAAATVAGVARRSGVHETTIYRRWATKEKLFVEAMLSRSAEEIPTPDTGSIRDDLLAVVRTVIAYVTTPVGLAMLHVASLAADDQQEARQAFWAGRKSKKFDGGDVATNAPLPTMTRGPGVRARHGSRRRR